MFAVPFPKPCSFLPPVALNSCFCLSGLKAWKWLRVARRCQEERAQGGVGTPRSPQGEERSRLPLQQIWGAEQGKDPGPDSPRSFCISTRTPNPIQHERTPQNNPHRHRPLVLSLSPAHPPGTRGTRGRGISTPWPCRGPGPLGSSGSQAHTGSQVRRAGPGASRRDVVFSHSPGAGPRGSGTLRGFGSHTGCH